MVQNQALQDISEQRMMQAMPPHQQQMPAPPQQDKQGLFAQKKQGPSPEVVQLTSKMGELGRRIRVLEDRYSNIRRKTQVTDQNMLSIQKSISREMKGVDSQITELQKALSQLDDKMKQVMREIDNFAYSEDVRVLKRYMEFWRPLDYISREEAQKMIVDVLASQKDRKA